MEQFLLILLATVLVNNYLVVQFLGLCPFMGVSNNFESAVGMSAATTFVLTLASIFSYLVHQYLLVPLGIEFLKTISFIVVIASVVTFSKMFIEKNSPVLYRILGIFIPLITTNCAVLGVALQNTIVAKSLFEAMNYGLGAALGFSLVLIMFAAMREQLQYADIPKPFRGTSIAMITAGIIALAFMGFAGMA